MPRSQVSRAGRSSGPFEPQGEGESAGVHLRGCRELAVLEPGSENGHGLEKRSVARSGASGRVTEVRQ